MRGRRDLFASVSEDDFPFSVQHFGRVHVHVAWHAQNFRRVVLRAFANCIVRAASSGDNVQTRGRRGTSRECHFAWQGAIFGADPLCVVEYHFAWQAQFFGHYTLYTPHFHFTLHNLQSTLYILHFTLHTPEFTLYILNFTPYTPHFTFYTPHFTLHTLNFTLHTPQSPLHTLHTTFPTQHSTFFTLHTLYFTPFHIPQCLQCTSTVTWESCTKLFK